MENLYTIEQVFSGKLFRIPDYQRGYAWGRQQCQEFVEDVELLEPERQHFLGTLILHSRGTKKVIDNSGSSYTEFDVVDGQQRLTTVAILLRVISQFMAETDDLPELAVGLGQKYLVGVDLNKRPLPKLSLNEDSRDFFNQAILGQGTPVQGATIRSHQRLLEAQAFFQDYLREQQESLGGAFVGWLQTLFFTLIQRLTLMVYVVEREADAGIIFETMNNRGKPITEMEKVKNYLLYLAGKLHLPTEHELVGKINKTWKHIFESLMMARLGSQDNEDQLLRAHWLMVYDPLTKNWEGSRSVKGKFNLRDYQGRHEELLAQLHIYLDSLFNAATAYCDVLRPKRPGAFQIFEGQAAQREIVGEAARLARLGSLANFLPLLMSVRIQYPADGRSYVACVQLCEKYAFRVFRWLGLRSNAGQSSLLRLGFQLYHHHVDLKHMQDRLAQLILSYASDGQFEAGFDNEEANWYQWTGLKYYLYEYERYLAQQKGVPVKMPYEEIARKQDSIEHILPQTPDKTGYWRERFPGHSYQRWLNDVGNLTLTYVNPELRNRPFTTTDGVEGKKIYYEDSVLLMEKELADLEEWTIETVQARRDRLKAWTLQRWQVAKPEVTVEEKEEVIVPAKGPTSEDYRRIFTRRPVSRGQKQLFKALYDAGDGGLTNDELVRVMGRRDRYDLVGVLGALGRRINKTPGYGLGARPGIGMLMNIEPAPGNQWRYFLNNQTCRILEELNPPWLHEMVK